MNPDAIAMRGRHIAPVLWRQAWVRANAKKRRYGKVRDTLKSERCAF